MPQSISQIKQMLDTTEVSNLPQAIEEFVLDERKGVIKLLESAKKRYENHLAEQNRLWEISAFERECYEKGHAFVGGIDEVGRGPLAGPVVAAVVILKQDCGILGINDSKKLSETKREELYNIIIKEAVDYCVGVVSPKEIDEINILQATYKAMQKAVEGLKIKPDFLLVDAVTIPKIHIPQKGIIKGDARSISIGAASIVAKVTRDKMMIEYGKAYTGYDFESNKGYGSQRHIEGIKQNGLSPIHRRSFVGNII